MAPKSPAEANTATGACRDRKSKPPRKAKAARRKAAAQAQQIHAHPNPAPVPLESQWSALIAIVLMPQLASLSMINTCRFGSRPFYMYPRLYHGRQMPDKH